jgi:hypothetical protein
MSTLFLRVKLPSEIHEEYLKTYGTIIIVPDNTGINNFTEGGLRVWIIT